MNKGRETLAYTANRSEALKDMSKIISNWMDEAGWFKTCANCFHYDHKLETCMKFQQKPPAKVIVVGCEHHEDIPF